MLIFICSIVGEYRDGLIFYLVIGNHEHDIVDCILVILLFSMNLLLLTVTLIVGLLFKMLNNRLRNCTERYIFQSSSLFFGSYIYIFMNLYQKVIYHKKDIIMFENYLYYI
jgi:hypothetical protein